jgi:hypothetical protein
MTQTNNTCIPFKEKSTLFFTVFMLGPDTEVMSDFTSQKNHTTFTYLQQPFDWQLVFPLFSSCVFLEDKIYEAWNVSE